jgi:hypothetical protein
MEYMRLEGVLGGAVSRLINKGIAAKVGYKPNVQLNEFKLYTDDSDTIIANLTVKMSQEDFNRLIEEATK